MHIAGTIVTFAGILLMAFGIVGMFRFKNFYARILVSGLIDTVGAITLVIGTALKHGSGFFSLKLVLLAGIIIIINPLVTHMVAHSAYLSGHKTGSLRKEDSGENT